MVRVDESGGAEVELLAREEQRERRPGVAVVMVGLTRYAHHGNSPLRESGASSKTTRRCSHD